MPSSRNAVVGSMRFVLESPLYSLSNDSSHTVRFCIQKANATESTPQTTPQTTRIHVDDDRDARTRARANALDASVRSNGQDGGEPDDDDDDDDASVPGDDTGVGFAPRGSRREFRLDGDDGVATTARDDWEARERRRVAKGGRVSGGERRGSDDEAGVAAQRRVRGRADGRRLRTGGDAVRMDR